MSQLRWLLACLAAFVPATAVAQQPKPKAMVGAYYFDGWSGKTENHVTKLLDNRVCRPEAGLGLDGRHGGDHAEADRLLCRPRHRLLGLRLVLPGGQDQDDAAEQRPRFVPQGPQLPAIEVLPAGGEPRRVSASGRRTGTPAARNGSNFSRNPPIFDWTASRS